MANSMELGISGDQDNMNNGDAVHISLYNLIHFTHSGCHS